MMLLSDYRKRDKRVMLLLRSIALETIPFHYFTTRPRILQFHQHQWQPSVPLTMLRSSSVYAACTSFDGHGTVVWVVIRVQVLCPTRVCGHAALLLRLQRLDIQHARPGSAHTIRTLRLRPRERGVSCAWVWPRPTQCRKHLCTSFCPLHRSSHSRTIPFDYRTIIYM